MPHHRVPWSTRMTSHDDWPKKTSVETIWDRRSMQTGQFPVTEPIVTSTEIGMHRLHPLYLTGYDRRP